MGKSKVRPDIYGYLLIAPGFILISAILLFPLFRGVLSSFFAQEANSLGLTTFIGLQNYRRVINDGSFWMTIENTFFWVVAAAGLQYIIGLLTALLLNKEYPGRGIFRSLVLIPWVIPTIAGALTWRWIFDFRFGILNHSLRTIGITERGFNWLGSTELALWSCIIVAVWKSTPFVTIVLLAGLQGIDRQLYEAANIDGASAFQKFLYITMPGIKEISIVSMVLRIIWTYNQFDIVALTTNGGPANSSMILPVYTWLMAFAFNQLNYSATIATVGLIVIMPVAVFYIYRVSSKREA